MAQAQTVREASAAAAGIDIAWAKVDLTKVPRLVSPEIPGPRSRELHGRAVKVMKGLSGQVKLFPVVFESGKGCTMTDEIGRASCMERV